MTNTFFEYIQPTLWMCNLMGLTYITTKDRRTILRQAIEFLSPLPYLSLVFYVIFNLMTIDSSADKRYVHFPNFAKISDVVGVITGTLCLTAKLLYYYRKRDAIKNIIIQVCESIKINFSILRSFADTSIRQKYTNQTNISKQIQKHCRVFYLQFHFIFNRFSCVSTKYGSSINRNIFLFNIYHRISCRIYRDISYTTIDS